MVRLLLAENENKLTVCNRVRAAAARRVWILEFPRTQGPMVRFKVVSENGDEATELFSAAHDQQEEPEEMAIAA